MTIIRVIGNQFDIPTRLMDIKYLSPLIVLIVRDGALFYFLYVTSTRFSFICMDVLLFGVVRQLGVCLSTHCQTTDIYIIVTLGCSRPARQYYYTQGF